ncbi:MAG: transglutaminase domain-containing protein [Eubacteriales bacterium]|nr:transglutaminase domain-containing protein [Eubacteriales bacterium]
MKKRTGYMMLAISFLLCLTGCSFAEQMAEGAMYLVTNEPAEVRKLRQMEIAQTDEGHMEYYFQQLSEEEKRAYREILMGVRAYKAEIYLSVTDNEQIDRAYHALLRDHPEVFWIHGRQLVYKTIYDKYTLFEPESIYSAEEIQEGLLAVENAWQQVNSLIGEDFTDYQKVKTVYTWIIQNTDYVTTEADQNIEGVFGDGQAVCAGYTGAAQYLLERMSIPCIYVCGDSTTLTAGDNGHAWNLIMLDGSWYYMDVTNGDQPGFFNASDSESNTVLYDYLCPFPQEYARVSQPDDEFTVPECTEIAYNDAMLNGGIFSYYDFQDVLNYAISRIDMGENIVRMKFMTDQEFQTAMTELVDGKGIQEIARYYINMLGVSQMQYHYGVLDELNTLYVMF